MPSINEMIGEAAGKYPAGRCSREFLDEVRPHIGKAPVGNLSLASVYVGLNLFAQLLLDDPGRATELAQAIVVGGEEEHA